MSSKPRSVDVVACHETWLTLPVAVAPYAQLPAPRITPNASGMHVSQTPLTSNE